MMERIAAEPLERHVAAILTGHGVSDAQARSVARNTIWSALVGRDNFSFGRLPIHVRRLEAGVLNGAAEPTVEPSGNNIALIDGQDGFGHYAGERGMAEAIDLAAQSGTGIAAVRNSNFFGTGAYFVNMAAEAGMIGIAASNSFPKVIAHGGNRAVLGTNPFAFGAPRADGRHLLFDMATSGLAGSTVRQHIAEGTPLPEGLAVAPDGSPVTDPRKVSEGALTPFGGAKGYGLALMVEILAGVLTGAGMAEGVASLYNNFDESGHSGHFLMAIDIARFMPLDAFTGRMDMLAAMLRESGPEGAVLLPGEVRWQAYDENKRLGIRLTTEDRRILAELAAPLGLTPPWSEAA